VQAGKENLPVSGQNANAELEKNIAAYAKIRDKMESEHLGRLALLSDGKLVAVYDDESEAYAVGCEKFGIGAFLLEKIGQKPLRVGGSSLAWLKSANG